MTAQNLPYITPTDVQGVLDEFEWLGIVRKTGRFRKCQPVYEMTEFGIEFGNENPGDQFDEAIQALIRRKLARERGQPGAAR